MPYVHQTCTLKSNFFHLILQKIHNNDQLPTDWLSLTNITCNNNQYVPCDDRSVYDILQRMVDLYFTVKYRAPALNKLRGGQ